MTVYLKEAVQTGPLPVSHTEQLVASKLVTPRVTWWQLLPTENETGVLVYELRGMESESEFFGLGKD